MNNIQVSALTAALRANFFLGYEETAETAPNDPFTTIIPSTTRIENYPNWTPAPAMMEWDGMNDYGTLSSYVYSIENKIYRASLMIRVPDLEDDQTGALAKKPKELSTKAKDLKSREVMKALASGQTGTFAADGTSYGLGFDGTAFFAAAHNFGTGSNLLTQFATADSTSGSPTAANTYQICALFHGAGTESLKPMIWQQRKGPEFRTNVGTDQSDEVLQVRMWATLRGRAAYGIWFRAIKQPILGLPTQAEMHTMFANIEAAFRLMQLPKSRATSFGEYVYEQTQFSAANLTIAGSTGVAEVLRQALNADWTGQTFGGGQGTGGASAQTVATTNRFKGWANSIVSAFLN